MIFSGIKTYLYIGLAMAVVGLATAGFVHYTGLQAELKNKTEAIAELEIQKVAMEIQKKSDKVVIDSLQIALATQAEAITIVNEQFSTIRDDREKQKRVLDGSRLGRLAADQAGRIESLSNSATRARGEELEGIINEDF